jgi:ferredoxin
MGCGLCVIKCPQKAITLELIRPPEHIPADIWDTMRYGKEKYSDWMTADL